MTPSRAALSEKIRRWRWLAVPALVMAFVGWDAVVRTKHVLATSEGYGVTVDAPRPDPASATGYEGGRRSMVLPEAGEDTAHWVMQTQTMIARGEWRMRKVDYDNAPRGREVHWAAPLHWWLAALAWIDHAVTGRSLGVAVEWAALTSGPVMFGLLFLGLMPLLARKFSVEAAALGAIGAVAVRPFYTDFLPGRADHHGLANICGLFTVLFLAAANCGNDLRAARRWFGFSAIAGGVGLWISAATLVPVLIGIGCGVLGASWLARKQPGQLVWTRDPHLWRIWGCVGGGVAGVAYLIEYFPAHLGMRLEVNHPLYAAAWVGAGETLGVLAGAIVRGRKSLSRSEQALGVGGAGLVLLLPLTIFFTGEKTFTVAEPFIWRLHVLHISEFQSLGRFFAAKGVTRGGIELCLPMLLLLPPLVALLRSKTSRDTKAQLVLALCPAAIGWVMAWNQLRWLGLAYVLSLPALALFFRNLESAGKPKRASVMAWAFACGVFLAPGAVSAVQRTWAGDDFTKEDLHHLVERDVAHWLRLRAGEARVVVAGAPSSTTALISFGGVAGLGTLYWENAEGLKHAGALFASASPEAARDLGRSLGVTHIVLFSWDAFEVELAHEYRGLPPDAPIPADLFVAKLLSSAVPPPWLRAIPFKLPDNPALTGEQVRIWEVVPEQTPVQSVAHAVNYYLELGLPQVAERLVPMLAGFKDDLTASVMLGGIASRQRDAAAFSRAAERVDTQLSQVETLSLDDRVHLVVVLVVGQQAELARSQLLAALRMADETKLRHLTPGTLSDLLALSDALGVDWPEPALKRLAERLVPPARRK